MLKKNLGSLYPDNWPELEEDALLEFCNDFQNFGIYPDITNSTIKRDFYNEVEIE